MNFFSRKPAVEEVAPTSADGDAEPLPPSVPGEYHATYSPQLPLEQRLERLTEQQKQLLQEFKDYLLTKIEKADTENAAVAAYCRDVIVPDEMALLRFLNAREWVVQKAAAMAIHMVKWRLAEHPENVTAEMCRNGLQSGKAFVLPRYDRLERPCTYISVKMHNANTRVWEDEMYFTLFLMEAGKRYMRPHVDQFVVVFDLEGFGMSNMDYKFTKYFIELLSNYYPETLGGCLILGAGWLFQGCWKLIKPWINAKTADKIRFCTKEQLLEYFDVADLPVFLGGKLEWRYDPERPIQLPERGQ